MSATANEHEEDPGRRREYSYEEVTAMLEPHLRALGEHFDSVQIIATRFVNEQQGTNCYSRGVGDWYARFGGVSQVLANMEGMMQPESGG